MVPNEHLMDHNSKAKDVSLDGIRHCFFKEWRGAGNKNKKATTTTMTKDVGIQNRDINV